MAKILIAAIHYPVASGRYIARALERMGHDVKTTGAAMENKIWGLETDPRWNWTPSFVYDFNDRWEPDLIVTADSAFYFTDISIPSILYGVDNHCRDYRFDNPKFDHYFMAHSWGACMDKPNATWLPCAYDPKAHGCIKFSDERTIDIGFIGYPYPDRVELVSQLRAAGLNVKAALGLLWDDYNAAMNLCKIALIKSFNGDLAQRFFENMAQGCCVLADRTVDADKLGFEPGVDYWTYTDPEDAQIQARYLLETGIWRQVAASGQAKVMPHTWDARCQVILDEMGIK